MNWQQTKACYVCLWRSAYLVTWYARISLLAHSPRSSLGKCINLAHIHQPLSKSFKPSVDVLPLAQLCPLLPSVRQTPFLPGRRLAQFHPGDLGNPCSPGEMSSMSRYAVSVQTSPIICKYLILKSLFDKHFRCHAYRSYWPSCLPLQPRTIQAFHRRANWQTSKNERCIFTTSKWTGKPFLLVFLFHQFCQVYLLDPSKRKWKLVDSGHKELSFHGNWIKFGVCTPLHLPLHPLVQEAQGVLPFLSYRFHPCLL